MSCFKLYLLLVFALLPDLSASLDHEKSYLLQEGSSAIFCVGFYKDSILVTSTSDIVQKDLETGAFRRTFRAHTNQVPTFVVVNETIMISIGWDDMIIMWDLDSGSILKRISLGSFQTLTESAWLQGEMLFTGGADNKVRQTDLGSGRVLKTIEFETVVYSVIADGDDLYIGGVGIESPISKLQISTGDLQFRFIGHTNTVYSMYLTDDRLFSGSSDKLIICWNSENGDIVMSYSGHEDFLYFVTVFNEELYSGDWSGHIIKWNIKDGQILKLFPEQHTVTIGFLDFRNQYMFSASRDETVVKWDINTSSPVFVYRGRTKRLVGIVLWKNYIISGSADSFINFWDFSFNSIDPYIVYRNSTNAVTCLFLNEDILFYGSSDDLIRQLNLTSLQVVQFYVGHVDIVNDLVVDDSYLYSAGRESTLKQWDIVSGNYLADFIGHVKQLSCLQFVGHLFSGSWDQSVRMWDINTKQQVARFSTTRLVFSLLILDDTVIAGIDGLETFTLSTGESSTFLIETTACFCIFYSEFRLITGHQDSLIRTRDYLSLATLSVYQGHLDAVNSLFLDNTGILISSSIDGTIKKWNSATRRVAFSFENRNFSVTAIAADAGSLFIGTKNGVINSFSINNAMLISSFKAHDKSVSSLASNSGALYSSGFDGKLVKNFEPYSKSNKSLYDFAPEQIIGFACTSNVIAIIRGDFAVSTYLFSRYDEASTITFSDPVNSVAVTDSILLVGLKSGRISAWNIGLAELLFNLDGHTAQVNSLLVEGNTVFSASNDKIIFQWSLENFSALRTFKRLSAVALGHLGPVNGLSLCNGVLFSAGSDTSVRRWNTQTGRHEDVYFGFTKSVTTILCYNSTVFAGSEDFSVLSFRPNLPPKNSLMSSSRSSSSTAIDKKTLIIQKARASRSTIIGFTTLIVITIAAVAVIVILSAVSFLYYMRTLKETSTPLVNSSGVTSTYTATSPITDMQTLMNSVMGVSKHAAFLLPKASIAKVEKIAAGGGGELHLAKVMDPALKKLNGDFVIQKIVFHLNNNHTEAFYQEVGIMIFFLPFPHFCKIVGYTENPLSMVLKYYPAGSLFDWIRKNSYGRGIIVKIMKECALALKTMHSNYMAHCDLKPQNILVEEQQGVPSCFLTDFGITQILSDKIVAAKVFNVINQRGLSIFYASPESITSFATKNYYNIDYKAYDIYSYGCITYEVMTQKAPWRNN